MKPRHRAERRRRGLLWMGGATASLVLVLGIHGTLAAWTVAALATVDNVVKPDGSDRTSGTETPTPPTHPGQGGGTDGESAPDSSAGPDDDAWDAPAGTPRPAVVLQELSTAGEGSCDSSTTIGNAVDCAMINKYGGTADPLGPGESRTTTVTMRNAGRENGRLTIVAGACANAGGAASAAGNLCDVMQVEVTCGGTKFAGSLREFAEETLPILIAERLAPGEHLACAFTVSLPATARSDIAGMTVTQAVTWTLAA